MDCGYYTFNDIMINELYTTFGLSLTEEEINEDADTLAQAKLDACQLERYNALRDTNREAYDAKLRSICLVGGNGNYITPLQTVSVAGYDVTRNCQVNIGYVNGNYDTSYYFFNTMDDTKAAWYTGGEDATLEQWYVVDDVNASCTTLGGFYDVSIASDTALEDAFDNRTARIAMLNPETHSKNFLSIATAADIAKYFEQTLNNNNGMITNASTMALDVNQQIWPWRTTFNALAMVSMLGMVVAVLGILIRKKFYAPCIATVPEEVHAAVQQKAVLDHGSGHGGVHVLCHVLCERKRNFRNYTGKILAADKACVPDFGIPWPGGVGVADYPCGEHDTE